MNGIKNLLHDIFLLKSTRAFKKRTRSFLEKHTCFRTKARVLFPGYYTTKNKAFTKTSSYTTVPLANIVKHGITIISNAFIRITFR